MSRPQRDAGHASVADLAVPLADTGEVQTTALRSSFAISAIFGELATCRAHRMQGRLVQAAEIGRVQRFGVGPASALRVRPTRTVLGHLWTVSLRGWVCGCASAALPELRQAVRRPTGTRGPTCSFGGCGRRECPGAHAQPSSSYSPVSTAWSTNGGDPELGLVASASRINSAMRLGGRGARSRSHAPFRRPWRACLPG